MKDLVEFCIQFLDAIHFIHQKDIFHGDIQPKNIYFKSDVLGSILKLTGFNKSSSSNDEDQSIYQTPIQNEK